MRMHNKQQGIVLIISMIMLLMMTLLGVTAMKTALMEEKMAGNTRDATLAFHAAETALRDAEVWVANQGSQPPANSTGSNRVWTKNSMDSNSTNAVSWWQEQNQSWWLNNAEAYGTALVNVKTVPHSIIEEKETVLDTLGMAEMATATGIGQQLVGNEALTGKFIEQIKTLNNQMAIPSTLAVLKESDIKGIAKAARKEAHFDYTYPVPKYVNQRGCEAIIRKMLA